MARKSLVPHLFVTLLLVAPATVFAVDAVDNAATTPAEGEAAGAVVETVPPGSEELISPPREPDFGEDPFREEVPPPHLADPLEPLNRALFVFNDKLYFWVLKPVARGYAAVIPKTARFSVRNFFSNIAMPIRFVNNLLQGKIRNSGVVLLRFFINTTAGIGGLFDPATNDFHLEPREEDLGQTLGKYGFGHGFYIVIPFIGPSSLRDGIGLTGDLFLHPATYTNEPKLVVGAYVLFTVNRVSLAIGEYEDLKKSAIDPYVALRDAYSQYRDKKVRE